MSKTKTLLRVFVATAILAILVGAVGFAGAQDEEKVLVTGITMVGGDVPTLDPSLAETSSSIEIINQMFIGLTFQDELTAETVNGVVTDYSVSEDGTVYTFNLIQELPWVQYNFDTGEVEQATDEEGNVRYVTADDFVYGFERALAPETASPYSYVLLPYMTGAAEFNAGEGSFEDVGIEAVDEYTLQITSPEAVGFTPSIFALWMTYALPEWTIEENGDLWTEPEYINTYGPFALMEWAHDESVTLTANPFWPGTEALPQPVLDQVVFRFLDPETQLAEYEAGTMDASSVPVEQIDRVKADPTLSQEYTVGTQPCTYYVGFDNTEEPFTNANLRRALSQAINRQAIVDNVTKGGQIAAQWFSRPGLNAAPTLETNPDLGVQYNPQAAQESLQTALEELGLSSVEELPAITLSYNDSSGHAAIMQAIQQMWTETLGITAQLVALEPSTYFTSVSEDAPMIYRSGWCQDYSDANNFLYDVFRSDSSQNDTGFANEEYDEIVAQARVETDVDARRELYVQAEEILVDQEAAIAPIYWYTTNQLTRPYVERTYSITGQENYSRWDLAR